MNNIFVIFLGLTVAFILHFFLVRVVIAITLGNALNRSNLKNRKNKQSFCDWLFYRRFKEVLPNNIRIW